MNDIDLNINEKLAHIRNMLLNNRFGSEEKEMLMLAKNLSKELGGPFSGLIEKCINYCLVDIKSMDFNSAALEINFIHNLPIRTVDISKWDENHFYSVEILSYMETTKKYDRIKLYIFEIARAQEMVDASTILR